MTDRATLEALLARVMEGEGPDRELDGQIALLKGYTYEKRKGDKFAWWRRPDGFRVALWSDKNKPPPYTASLDAALTVFFGNPPPLIPSEPRLVLRDALRDRMEAQDE